MVRKDQKFKGVVLKQHLNIVLHCTCLPSLLRAKTMPSFWNGSSFVLSLSGKKSSCVYDSLVKQEICGVGAFFLLPAVGMVSSVAQAMNSRRPFSFQLLQASATTPDCYPLFSYSAIKVQSISHLLPYTVRQNAALAS